MTPVKFLVIAAEAVDNTAEANGILLRTLRK